MTIQASKVPYSASSSEVVARLPTQEAEALLRALLSVEALHPAWGIRLGVGPLGELHRALSRALAPKQCT